MDDRRFDDIVKGKVENYQPEAFDPAALADLHHRMAALPVQLPWYSNYRTELLVASTIVLISALNALFFWLPSQNSLNQLSDELSTLKSDNQQIDQLQTELNDFRLENTGITDTIYLQSNNSKLIYELASLNTRLNRLIAEQEADQVQNQKREEDGLIYLGKDEEIPEDILYQLLRKGLIRTDGEYNYLVATGVNDPLYPIGLTSAYNNSQEHPEFGALSFEEEDEPVDKPKRENIISVKTQRELEKHYSRGVGVKISPVLGLNKTFYNAGDGLFKPEIGLLVDLIISPSLSIETGLKYNVWSNEIEGNDLNEVSLPDVNSQLGDLQIAEVDAYLLEIPVALKYRYPLGDKAYFTTSLGYSPVLYFKQDFDYDYLFFLGNDPTSSIPLNVNDATSVTSNQFYAGTANIGLGYSRKMKKENFLDITMQYRHGLTEMGVEEVKPRIFSLRAGYWFKIR